MNMDGDHRYDEYRISIVNECVMAENEPIVPIIFAREALRAGKVGGRRGKNLPVAKRESGRSRAREFLAQGMRCAVIRHVGRDERAY